MFSFFFFIPQLHLKYLHSKDLKMFLNLLNFYFLFFHIYSWLSMSGHKEKEIWSKVLLQASGLSSLVAYPEAPFFVESFAK